MATFIDSFDGAAGTLLSSRTGWANGFGYYDLWQLDGSGAASHPVYAGDGKQALHDTGSLSHYVKVVLGTGFLGSARGCGIILGGGVASGALTVEDNGGDLYLFLGGGSLQSLGSGWAAGDELEVEWNATTQLVTVRRNGVQVGAAADLAGHGWTDNGSSAGLELAYAGQPARTDVFRSFEAGPLAPPDTTPPTLTGTITLGARTASSIETSCPAATDDVAVTAYDVRIDGGAWIDKGLATSHNFTGLTADTAHTIDWTARDAAGNRSTPPLSVSTSTYPVGAMASTILLLTGPQDGNPAGMLYALAGTVQPGDWLSYYIVSGPTPAGGVLDAQANGAFAYTGPSPAVLVIQPYVNGVATPEPITVNLYDQAGGGDTESPTLSGTITVNSKTSTSINVSCPAATDNVGVVDYEWSSNGGTSWIAGTTTHNFTGLAAGTQYQIRVRASDAAGNKSSALSLAVTTDAEAAPVLAGTITVSNKTSTSITASCPSASGSVTGYEWSIGGGWVSDTTSHSFTGLTASTEYTVQVRAVGPGGNSAALSLSVTTDAVAAPVLSSPTASATGQTTATGSVQTTVASGTLYWLVNGNSTATAAEVKAASSQAVTAAGSQNVSITGLTAGTQYYVHYLHSATGDSAVVRSAQFSTTAMTVRPLVWDGQRIRRMGPSDVIDPAIKALFT